MNLEYFHGDRFSYGRIIQPAKELPVLDPDFLFNSTDDKALPFADYGDFIKGCIRISKT